MHYHDHLHTAQRYRSIVQIDKLCITVVVVVVVVVVEKGNMKIKLVMHTFVTKLCTSYWTYYHLYAKSIIYHLYAKFKQSVCNAYLCFFTKLYINFTQCFCIYIVFIICKFSTCFCVLWRSRGTSLSPLTSLLIVSKDLPVYISVIECYFHTVSDSVSKQICRLHCVTASSMLNTLIYAVFNKVRQLAVLCVRSETSLGT